MLTIVLFLVLFVVVSGGMMLLANGLFSEPGYVLITFNGMAFETSFATAVTAIVVSIILLILVAEVIRRMTSSRFGPRYWLANRQQDSARFRTSQGLIELARGDYDKAGRSLVKSASKADSKLVNYLNAARAANAVDAIEERNLYLKQADELYIDPTAVALTRAELQFEREQWEACIVTVESLRETAPKNKAAIDLQMRAYNAISAWHKLADLLPEIKKFQVIKTDQVKALELEIFMHRLLEERSKSALIGEQVQAINALWKNQSTALKKEQGAVIAYGKALIDLNEGDQAQSLIQEQLKKDWSEELVVLYGEIDGANLEQRNMQAKKWLQKHPSSSSLLFCLGKIANRSKDFDAAKEYFQSSLKLRQSVEVSAAYGQMLAALNEHEASNEQLLVALA